MRKSSSFIVCWFVVQGDEQGEDTGARKGFQVTCVVSGVGRHPLSMLLAEIKPVTFVTPCNIHVSKALVSQLVNA